MSSATEPRPRIRNRVAGGVLLASSFFLFAVYAEGQFEHTVRFLFEVLAFLIRGELILPF